MWYWDCHIWQVQWTRLVAVPPMITPTFVSSITPQLIRQIFWLWIHHTDSISLYHGPITHWESRGIQDQRSGRYALMSPETWHNWWPHLIHNRSSKIIKIGSLICTYNRHNYIIKNPVLNLTYTQICLANSKPYCAAEIKYVQTIGMYDRLGHRY